MTDPIQATQGQQQGQQWQPIQQWTTDDILAWDDIFAATPESIAEDTLAQDDILEKEYPFEPIPEGEEVSPDFSHEAPEILPEQEVTPEVEPELEVTPEIELEPKIIPEVDSAPEITEEVVENVADEEVQDVVDNTIEEPQLDSLLDTKLQTDVQKKFGELFFTTKKIYQLKERMGIVDETFDILWANNDKVFISYRFFIDESESPLLFITKIEQDKETEEETTNELKFTFNEEASSLEVMVNDTLLFDEIQDFTEDQRKKLQVVDKINKFTFLASEELRKKEKQIKEKEEDEKERRKLQEIFRNF